jgi:hypothetical protein
MGQLRRSTSRLKYCASMSRKRNGLAPARRRRPIARI